jgi:uncharacterized repeat protein (TIGR02543 family)
MKNFLTRSFGLVLVAAALAAGLSGCPGANDPGGGTAYTVTFDSQGGSAVDAQTVAAGARAAEPGTAPVKAGYTFGGWYRDPAGTAPWDFNAGTVTADITLYAKWTKKAADADSAAALQGAGTITVPAGEDGTGGAEIRFGDTTISIKIGEETVEYPCVITEDALIITKDGEEVSIGYTVTDDGKLHISGGLDKIDESLPAGAVEPATENGVVKPGASYVVSFNPQGGSSVPGVSVASGGKLTKPADPGRDGYTFAGWYKDAAGTAAWDFDTDTVSGNTTLYAK